VRLERLLRAFRHRNYRLFFGGQLVSVCGTWMRVVAQSWLVYRLTGSAVLLGLVGFCSQIPVLLLSPIAGVVADRYDRRRTIVGTQIASMLLAFALAALTLSGQVRVWHVPVLAALLGVVKAFDVPTRQAFVVDMVGRGDLINAIALNSSMFNGARILGPSLAGVLVASLGEGWCFFANAVSYWVAVSTAGSGVSLILFALSRSFWLSAVLLVPVGFFMIGQLASSNTLIQMMVPDDLRGRAMAVYSMMLIGMAPFGSLLAGVLAEHLSAPAAVTAGGGACLVGAAVFGAQLTAFRHETRRAIRAGDMGSGDPGAAKDAAETPA
jgi:MFS family permease